MTSEKVWQLIKLAESHECTGRFDREAYEAKNLIEKLTGYNFRKVGEGQGWGGVCSYMQVPEEEKNKKHLWVSSQWIYSESTYEEEYMDYKYVGAFQVAMELMQKLAIAEQLTNLVKV